MKIKQTIRKILSANEIGVVFSLLILFVVIGSVNPAFFKFVNIVDVLRSACYSFVIAAPLTLVMMSGDMDLSIGAMQRVEILKMLYRDVDVLILDEPTSVLTPQ